MTVPKNLSEREEFYLLALAMTPGIGPVRFHELLKKYHSPEAVFRAARNQQAAFSRLPEKTVQALTRFDWDHKVYDEMERVRKRGLKLMHYGSPSYPGLLEEIYDPPPVLWIAGDLLPEDAVKIALVGSRRASDYGLKTAERIAGELAALGAAVVSGVALGIDAAAHNGAIRTGGRTYGVLGCGLDVIYPHGNRDLFFKIPQTGALVSEFPLGTKPRAGHFPRRNRIISGLCQAVVVVEASEKSGAAITAKFALEQNREVFAVPGPAGSESSRGSNALLKQGARLVESGEDIIEELKPQLHGWKPDNRYSNDLTSKAKFSSAPDCGELPPDASEEEKKVWDLLNNDVLHIDVMGRALGAQPNHLAALLLEMELKGLIVQMPGMIYKRN